MSLSAALASLAAACWLTLSLRVSLVAARMLQIEEYENARFLRWSRDRRWLGHRAAVASGAAMLLALVLAFELRVHAGVVVAIGWLAAGGFGNLLWEWIVAKRALSFTARMRRLLAATILLLVLVAAGTALLAVRFPLLGGAVAVLVSAGTVALGDAALVAANLALRPVEARVRAHYLRLARRRLQDVQPLVVAVAGSYGKTSTKHILAGLLGGDDVLPTRKSFNTLMGITRVVNEDLRPAHRVFIVEMDAYARGEIAAMCELAHPSFAMITSVGPQHLERFGSMAGIADALYECVAALPPEGVAVIHVGEPEGAALARRAHAEARTVVRYALEGSAVEEADVLAADVRISGRGTSFRWRWPARGLERDVELRLLGRHQTLNVSAALAMAHLLERPLDDAVRAAAALQPVEHRLQPMPGAGAVTVIDDSYNANPVGVHEGLDVLAAFEGGAKILVTPGLVELGGLEEAENRRYGRHAAAVCDHVLVAEARTAPALRAGLREGGLASERIHTVRDLTETTALLAILAKAGDVVLFANDLPDTYLGGPRPKAVTPAGAGP